MISNSKYFTISILASLSTTVLTTYFVRSRELVGSFSFQKISSIFMNYTFFICWVVLLSILVTLRYFSSNVINKLQTTKPYIIFARSHYDMDFEVEKYDLKWRVYTIKPESPLPDDTQGIHIDKIEGPYCKFDFIEMEESRTYFGRYKYECPRCRYEKIVFKNVWTLKCNIKDEIDSTYKN